MATAHPQRLRVKVMVAGAASAALVAAIPAVSAHGAQRTSASTPVAAVAAQRAAVTVPGNVRFYQARTSLLGQHRWYRQVKGGEPVVGGWWAWHRLRATGRVTIWDGRVPTGKLNTRSPELSARSAMSAASKRASLSRAAVTGSQLMVLPQRGRKSSRLVWAVDFANGNGARTAYVDAVEGSVLKVVLRSSGARSERGRLVTGRGRTFDPNPVVKLQDESLTDQDDSPTAVPPKGYTARDLPRLVRARHTLVGVWARIINRNKPIRPDNHYLFSRHNPYFEQTNAYYSVDAAQHWLHRLGFTDANAEAQKVKTNAFPDDNSYYQPGADLIAFGRGGVDDAEDPEVVWHEYGHAVQDDQVPDWGSFEQGGAMGEGFGDYLAVTMSQRTAADTATTPTACVMDWDATSYTSGPTHCLRRTDTDKHWPEDGEGEVHADGEIWSAALWDMNQALGRRAATSITVEAHFWMNPRIRFKGASERMVVVARQLYGAGTATTVHDILAARGFIR